MHDAGPTDIPPLSACCLYLPGHRVHPIQARKAWQDDAPPEAGTLLDADATTVTVRVGEEDLRLRNHETRRLALVARAAGGRVELSRRRSVLWVRHPKGAHMFSIVREGIDWRACEEA